MLTSLLAGADTITGSYYYPKGPKDEGEKTQVSRPLKNGESAEWILLDGVRLASILPLPLG